MPEIRVEMAFGADPASDPAGWTWTDVTSSPEGHLLAQQVTIGLGRPEGDTRPQPASAALQLDDPQGWVVPDQPMSPYWPRVVLGVPCRIWVRAGSRHVLVPSRPDARISSTTAVTMPADLDIRAEVALDQMPAQVPDPAPSGMTAWAAQAQEVAGQYVTAGDQRSWLMFVNASGGLSLRWSTDGTFAGLITVHIPGALPYTSGQRFGLRVTLDVDDGAGRWVLRGWYATSMDGPWNLLGETTGTPATAVHAGTAPVQVADIGNLDVPQAAGRYYALQIRNGIDGDLLASPDFASMEIGDTSLVDAEGVTWQLEGDTEVTDWQRRLVGGVDDWALNWPYGDLSAIDRPDEVPGEARVGITVAGVLRRLQSGQPSLQSTLRRRIPSASPAPLAYWPMEDGRDAIEAASALPDGDPLALTGVQWAADDTLGGAAALPTMGQSTSLYGTVPGAAAGGWHAEMVYRLDEMPTTEQTVLRLYLSGASGGVASVRGRVSTSGIRIQALDEDEAVVAFFLFTNVDALAAFVGRWNRLQFFSFQDGGNCRVRMGWRDIETNSYWYAGTVWAGTAVGRITAVRGAWGTDWSGAGIGHLAVWDVGGLGTSTPGIAIYDGADDGYTGEHALTRMRRLAREEKLPCSVLGEPAESPQMGPQRIATVLELIQQCADADGGILSERRTVAGLEYLPRYLMYGRAGMTLDARAVANGTPASEIEAPFQPILDDQRRRNAIEMRRTDGSSALAEDAADIARSGWRPGGAEINIARDDDLSPIAHWQLHLGTWPGMRYPQIGTDLVIAPQRADDWLDAAPGTRVQVVNLPPQHPPGGADLLAEFITETISPEHWNTQAACSPAGPWTVGAVAPETPSADDPPHHVDADGSQLAVAVDTTGTTLSVVSGVFEGFESPNLLLDITPGGDAPWARDDSTAHTGTWSLRSGAITHDQTSDAVVAVPRGCRELQFWHRVDSEELFDFFRVLVDGVQVLAVSGDTGGWVQSDVIPVSGATAVTFRYAKDDIITAGSDAAWIDGVSFTSGPTWSTDPTDVPWDVIVGGERMTVTSVVGTDSPQEFTVTRSVNGVVKSHPAGADVRLADPMIVAL